MSRRIVSWWFNEPHISPVQSSASTVSVVSINSIVSDTHMMTTEATWVQPADLGVKLTNLPGSDNPMAGNSFVRHNKYFFKDGNITFLVDGTLYCVHRYFFSRDSAYFSTKFDQLDVRDHEPLSTIILLDDVEREDFEAFLSVLYPENFEEFDLAGDEQWKSVLHLSTRWGFVSIRKLSLSLLRPSPFDQLLLARTYSVDHWVLPGLSALCNRPTPIDLEEARQLSIEDVVVVATVREEICSQKPSVDTAKIECRIIAAQARMAAHVASEDVSTVGSRSRAAGKKPSKEAVTGTGVKAESSSGTKEVLAAITSKVYVHGSDEHSVGTADDPSAELRVKKKDKKK